MTTVIPIQTGIKDKLDIIIIKQGSENGAHSKTRFSHTSENDSCLAVIAAKCLSQSADTSMRAAAAC
jgi:hypothetical protein